MSTLLKTKPTTITKLLKLTINSHKLWLRIKHKSKITPRCRSKTFNRTPQLNRVRSCSLRIPKQYQMLSTHGSSMTKQMPRLIAHLNHLTHTYNKMLCLFPNLSSNTTSDKIPKTKLMPKRRRAMPRSVTLGV